jgi:hypothetical protein
MAAISENKTEGGKISTSHFFAPIFLPFLLVGGVEQ